MNKKLRSQRRADDCLNIAKVMEEFQKAEDSPGHRHGTFKIDKQFDGTLDPILKSNPELQKSKRRRHP